MTDQELGDRAVAAVRKEEEDAKHIRVGPIVRNFLGGDLVVVYFDLEDQADDGTTEIDEQETAVLVTDHDARLFGSELDLARAVVTHKPSIWRGVLAVNLIPGSIALVITVTICWLALAQKSQQIPAVLSTALTSILGFYFGTQVAKR